MSKTLEQKIEINGAIGSSFLDAFRKANQGMSDFQKEAKAIQRELNRLNNDFRSGRLHESQYIDETQKLGTELNSLERELKDAAIAQKRFAEETALAKRRLDEQATAAKKRNATLKSDLQAGVSNAYGKVKTGATIAAVGGTALATATAIQSVNVAADFEAQMSKVGAKTEATKEEMKALTSTALELGAKTSLSASQTALAMDELAAGGMDVNKIIAAMPGIIAGAEASGEDLTLVSNTVSSALSIWGLEADKAAKVSDVLAKSANISAASVEDFSYAFKYAGKPAADLGMSLEETAAAISIMTDAGIDGSSAGTSLRSALLKLAAPTKQQSKMLDKLGVSMKDSTGKAKPLAQIIGELDKATSGMTNVDKTAALTTIVGTEAVSGFMTLMSAGEDKLKSFTTQLENSAGSSAKASKAMMDNFAGAKEQMLGAFESAQIAAATPSLDVLKRAFQGVGAMIEENLPAIEAAGQNVADVLEDIFAPFIAYEEPIKPVITPEMDPNDAKAAMAAYQEALEQHNFFGGMNLGDKVHYMLDETIDHVSEWVQGDGGAKMQELFAELAGIAAGAWSSSFTTMLTGSMSELAEGDIGSAVAMGAAANAMTGGLLMSGGLAGGKWLAGKGMDKWKASRTAKADKATTSAVATATTPVKGKAIAQAPTVAPQPTQLAQRPNAKSPTTAVAQPTPRAATSAVANSGKGFGKMLLKGAGKVALPVAAATGVIEIVTSDNKAEATGKTVGGLAGGLGGAKFGAALGTLVAPGIGTAIGAAIGGIGGSIAGAWGGAKAGNAIAGPAPQNNTAVAQTQQNPVVTQANTALSASITQLTETTTAFSTTFTELGAHTSAMNTNFTALNTMLTTATPMFTTELTTLQTNTNLLNTNMNTLATFIGQATGWLVALQNIQPAAQRVVNALNTLEQRINAIELPGAPSARRTAYE